MKHWERVIEHKLRRETRISNNQFGFMPECSIIEAIFLLRLLMEKCRGSVKIFIWFSLTMWWLLENKAVPLSILS